MRKPLTIFWFLAPLGNFWFVLLQMVGLQRLSPQPDTSSFLEWWSGSAAVVDEQFQQGFYYIILLGAWLL
jgi:hypothetical protein